MECSAINRLRPRLLTVTKGQQTAAEAIESWCSRAFPGSFVSASRHGTTRWSRPRLHTRHCARCAARGRCPDQCHGRSSEDGSTDAEEEDTRVVVGSGSGKYPCGARALFGTGMLVFHGAILYYLILLFYYYHIFLTSLTQRKIWATKGSRRTL